MSKSVELKSLIHSDDALLRNLADPLRTALDELDNLHQDLVSLDLSGIKFMSRAFAHELSCLLEDRRGRGITVELTNVSTEVEKMLAAVGNSQPCSLEPERQRPRKVDWDTIDKQLDEIF